jgi:hypothetical protein
VRKADKHLFIAGGAYKNNNQTNQEVSWERAVAAAHGGLNGQWYASILGGSYFAVMVCCVPARTAMCENGYVCRMRA